MRRNPAPRFAARRCLTALASLPILLTASVATAGLKTFRTDPIAAPDHRAAAESFLIAQGQALGLDGVELEHVRSLGRDGLRTERFEQRYLGLPVLGEIVAVRLDGDRRVLATNVKVLRDFDLDPNPLVGIDQAKLVLGASIQAENVLLAVFPDETAAGGARLVWQFDVADVPGGTRYLVDAHDGSLVQARELAVDALGRVYQISAANTPNPTDEELLDLVVANPQKLTGWAGNLTVTQYVSGGQQTPYVVNQDLLPSSGSDFLYDPPMNDGDPTDPFASVNLYYHLTKMRNFFQDDLGVDFGPASYKVTAMANALESGQDINNAFYSPMGIDGAFASPNLIAIGQGQLTDFATDSDVFKHEFVHYTSYNAIGFGLGQTGTTEYGFEAHSGSLDEGTADYFACSENGDPLLGESSLVPLGGGRDLSDESKVCPQDMIGEVHADGELIGSFAWSVREIVGKAAGDQLVWGGLTLLSAGASFTEFSNALLETASELELAGTITAAQVQQIQAKATQRGLDECDHVIPIHAGQPRDSFLFGLDLVGQFFGSNCEGVKGFGVELQSLYHWSWEPQLTDTGMTWNIQLNPDDSGDLSYRLLIETGKHVAFMQGGFFPTAINYDYEFTSTGNSLTATIDANSDPPFDSSEVYYAVIVHQNCPNGTYSISVGPPGEGGMGGAGGSAGAGGGDVGGSAGGGSGGSGGGVQPEGGCGCTVPGSSTGGLAGALGLAALGLIRRRRRQLLQ